MMDVSTITNLITIAISYGTPLLIAALGEIYAERSGILNLGIEGIISLGAVVAFLVAYHTSSLVLAITAAMLAGALFAAIHAFICVYLKGNQIITGLALTMVGLGMSSLIGIQYVGRRLPIIVTRIQIPLLSEIPVIGALFMQDPVVYFSYLIVILLWFILHKTRIGLELRAVGEDPSAADTAGINVDLVRFLATVFGGAFAGFGGAYYSIVLMQMWIERLTWGKGWIALALVIFAMWDPLKAMIGAYLFGFIEILAVHLQIYGYDPYLLGMTPYIMAIAVLTLSVSRIKGRSLVGPTALGKPYIREEKALHG